MGIGLIQSQLKSIEDYRDMMLSCTSLYQGKGEAFGLKAMRAGNYDIDPEDRLVCVTSGVSYLGIAIVSCLLTHGYTVRLIVTNEDDLEKVNDMKEREIHNSHKISGKVANFGDVTSLCEAFEGCRGVFHTAALIDPAGLSGYTKSMVEIETKTCENVMDACARTYSVTKCVLTSTLLACIWGDNSTNQLSSTINHNNWSDESFCMEKKLWYALGKLRAEKVAWKVAEKRDFKLVTICPGLVTGPQFCSRNPTPSMAYLKGAQEMYVKGLLATVDVNKLAEAHVCTYEAMNKTASGRYICFDRVIQSEEEVEKLTGEMGRQPNTILGDGHNNSLCSYKLSNIRLFELMSRTPCRREL